MHITFAFVILFYKTKVLAADEGISAGASILTLSFESFSSNVSFASYFQPQITPVKITVIPYITASHYFHTLSQNYSHNKVYAKQYADTVTFDRYRLTIEIPSPMEFLIIDVNVLIETPKDLSDYQLKERHVRVLEVFDSTYDSLENIAARRTALLSTGESLNYSIGHKCSLKYFFGLNCDRYCRSQLNASADFCFFCNKTTGRKICCDHSIFDSENNCQRFSSLTTASSSTASHSANDRNKMYFWMTIVMAAFTVTCLILIVLLLVCCSIYYRRSKKVRRKPLAITERVYPAALTKSSLSQLPNNTAQSASQTPVSKRSQSLMITAEPVAVPSISASIDPYFVNPTIEQEDSIYGDSARFANRSLAGQLASAADVRYRPVAYV